MKENSRSGSGRGSAWCRAVFVLLAFANGGPANAESESTTFDGTGIYAGIFVGAGLVDHRIVDVEGFANWGNPGWAVDYGDAGFVGDALIGKQFGIGGMPLKIELDSTFGDLSAKTNKLDPEGLDETAASKFRWIATVRTGIEQAVGPATIFATGGLAVARIVNSVTDIDFGPGMSTRVDPDDSFHDSSTDIGWVIGLGVEAPLTAVWTLRLEGSYLDFGQRVQHVNRSGNGRCGPGNPRRPCPYNIDNTLGMIRLAIIRRFGL